MDSKHDFRVRQSSDATKLASTLQSKALLMHTVQMGIGSIPMESVKYLDQAAGFNLVPGMEFIVDT